MHARAGVAGRGLAWGFVRSVTVDLDIAPERAWELYSHPDAWSAWAPHIRGASGL
ncbi:MAG: hypothetical protein QOG68_1801, partial [Solirubrobacteraceae bacterium]|nr:hypothetical protein [Solirubrobacteraceae bacterium]